ncbi:hypothetical protein [Streptomyces sp. NPDC001508]|uniref:hypothetical protein n=1 Tax=Streptomyces sp. NPDC001508 TaxID=3154656 RepID=UPI0033223614
MVCKLSEDVRAKIQANFRGVLASHGRPAVEEIEVKKSNLPDRVYEYLTQERGLVDVSVDLAELLWDSQKGKSSSAGLLLVATARLAGKRALLIVKLEQEGGLRAQDVLVNGKRTFDMSYFADLLMTEHNKIYKAALFCVDGVSEDGPIEGRAARPPPEPCASPSSHQTHATHRRVRATAPATTCWCLSFGRFTNAETPAR